MGTIFEKTEDWHASYTEDINQHNPYPGTPEDTCSKTRLIGWHEQ